MSKINVNLMADSQGGSVAPISSVMRNRILNGNMSIAQRGTSFTGVSLFQYTLDRMKVLISYSGGSTNVTQQSDAPDAGSKYSIRYTHATANTSSISNYCNRQSIETSNVVDFAGLSVTASFWYKSSRTGNHAIIVSPVGTTGGSATTSTFTVTSANTWEYKTITSTAFVGVTAWGADNAEGAFIDVGFNCGGTGQSAVSSGDYFAISRCQLEKGTQATGFEYRQYGTELALCQRYLPYFSGATAIGAGTIRTTTVGALSVQFPVTTRTAPTGLTTNATNINNLASLAHGGSDSGNMIPSFSSASVNSANVIFSNSGAAMTVGQGAQGFLIGSGFFFFTGCEL